jgi:hypothetical protein
MSLAAQATVEVWGFFTGPFLAHPAPVLEIIETRVLLKSFF